MAECTIWKKTTFRYENGVAKVWILNMYLSNWHQNLLVTPGRDLLHYGSDLQGNKRLYYGS